MTTSKRAGRWRWAALSAYLALTMILLAITWHFAGYKPDGVLSISDANPLTIRSDGTTLIVGTVGMRPDATFPPYSVGSIRLLDLRTGSEVHPSLPLDETGRILGAQTSDNDQRLVVVGEKEPRSYFVKIFDLSARAVILEKTVRFNVRDDEERIVKLSRDGRLLAWVTAEDEVQRAVVVWDLEASKERFQLPGRIASFQYSPDGKLLATREQAVPEQFQLFDTTTGDLVHSIRLAANGSGGSGFSLFKTPPTFSPDGRFVAVHAWFVQLIQVFDTASGKLCFQTNGRTPQFLPGGSLLGIRNRGGRDRGGKAIEAPEIVVWSPSGWIEMRAFRYDLGVDIGGRVEPHPWPIGRANQFGLIYRTSLGGSWGSTKSSDIADSGLGRALGLNIPRGIGLDVVDGDTGNTRTYHLDGPAVARSPYPFLQTANKILIPRSFETVEVWDIPPRRSYAAVWGMAGMMTVIGLLGYASGIVVRRVARRYRSRAPDA
ncbi:MAG: WD40 repeat domain-containing protein [Isosphaeraceae bacterium]